MAPKPTPHPTRKAGPASSGRGGSDPKGTPSQGAPARSPFPTKVTVPAKMKRGPKTSR
jgi:hypothetical protein